jgi:hypothetical protein
VYYLDNLELRDDNLPHDEFPRWKVYDQKVLGRIIKRDAKTAKNSERMVYGHLAVIFILYTAQPVIDFSLGYLHCLLNDI